MLGFQNPIPEIAGQTCSTIVLQQYWYRGELADEGLLFMRLGDVVWHRFFIDAGEVFWMTVDEPDKPDDFDDCAYTHLDIGSARGFSGKKLNRVSTIDLPGGGELRLEFVGGPTLVLRNIDDRSQVIVEQ